MGNVKNNSTVSLLFCIRSMAVYPQVQAAVRKVSTAAGGAVFPTAHACAQQRLHEKTADSLTAGQEALYVYRPLNGQRFTYASAGQSARAASSAMAMTSRWSCRIDAGT